MIAALTYILQILLAVGLFSFLYFYDRTQPDERSLDVTTGLVVQVDEEGRVICAPRREP